MHLLRAESVHDLNMNADCSRQVDPSHTSRAEAWLTWTVGWGFGEVSNEVVRLTPHSRPLLYGFATFHQNLRQNYMNPICEHPHGCARNVYRAVAGWYTPVGGDGFWGREVGGSRDRCRPAPIEGIAFLCCWLPAPRLATASTVTAVTSHASRPFPRCRDGGSPARLRLCTPVVFIAFLVSCFMSALTFAGSCTSQTVMRSHGSRTRRTSSFRDRTESTSTGTLHPGPSPTDSPSRQMGPVEQTAHRERS